MGGGGARLGIPGVLRVVEGSSGGGDFGKGGVWAFGAGIRGEGKNKFF